MHLSSEKQNHLLLTRSEPLNNDRTHEERVIVSASNLRWCSDGFEIKCWNGEKVHVIFSLDCCDREIMSYAATTAGISSDMVCDVLVQSMEKGFGIITSLPQHSGLKMKSPREFRSLKLAS